jgi:hypothetical protein
MCRWGLVRTSGYLNWTGSPYSGVYAETFNSGPVQVKYYRGAKSERTFTVQSQVDLRYKDIKLPKGVPSFEMSYLIFVSWDLDNFASAFSVSAAIR